MLKADRMAAILEHIAHAGSLDVAQLSTALAVSPATLRRDLEALQEQGLLVRTHGGAVPSGVGLELPLRHRAARHQPQKRAIGRMAAALVPDGAVVGMTGGTTVTEVARALKNGADTTVVTNALNIAAELAPRPRLKVVATGGVSRAQSYELVGPIAERTLGEFNIDVAVIGVDGITASRGLTTHDDVEASTNAAMIRQSARVIVVADATKVGRVRLARICPLTDIDEVVTDADADPAELAEIRAAGVEVVVAPTPAPALTGN
jgi:DeoR family transcriptional regulator of aga operon